MTTDRDRCEAPRADGEPCRGKPLPGGAFCFAHAPQLEARRKVARRKAGQNSAKVVRLRKLTPPRLVPVLDRLEALLEDVIEGRVSPRRATAAAAVSRAIVAVYQAGEHEEHLRAIEEQLRRFPGEAAS